MGTWTQTTFLVTQWLPQVITVALAAFGRGKDRDGKWGVELAVTLYINWSWAVQAFLWILEANYQIVRSDPYSPHETDYAFPSEVVFWCLSLSSYAVTFALLWNVALAATHWAFLVLFTLAPPTILVWFFYNTWSEVLISGALAIGLTVPFVFWLRYVLDPDHISVMLQQRPWTWLGVIDTHLRSDEEIERAKTHVG